MNDNCKDKKVILHIDVDSFFVSCETALRPELLNREIAIAVDSPNAIISSLSYAAKEKGLFVPQKLSVAKKICKDLIVLEPNFSLYQHFSKKIYDFLTKNYSKSIQIVSVDEWYIDVTDIWKKYRTIKNLASVIQSQILKQLSMPVSIGLSHNTFLAKMATAINKPMGITIITCKNLEEIIWPMEITKYYGIGNKSSSQLLKLGISTIGDLAKCNYNDKDIKKIFLNKTEKIINNANGIGNNNLNFKNNFLNSIGNEKTFVNGFTDDIKEIYGVLRILCTKVSQRLIERNLCGSHVTVNIQLDKQKKSKSMKLDKLINNETDIYFYARKIMNVLNIEDPLIGIGVTISKLESSFQNMTNHSLFTEDPKLNEASLIVEKINSKMNKKVVMLGGEFKEHKKSSQNKFL